jgi:hypothetical protein
VQAALVAVPQRSAPVLDWVFGTNITKNKHERCARTSNKAHESQPGRTAQGNEKGNFVMSLQEISPEQLAELFHHYHQVLAPEFGDSSNGNNETWQFIPEQEKKRLITAARLALNELAADGNEQDDKSKYFAKPGEAEWGC